MTRPLSGVRVLDLSQFLAGPYGTQILADLGAEVIKIEQPGVGDGCRGFPPHFRHGFSGYFLAVNRNKKSLTLDLKLAEGREVFYDLVRCSDVVYDNFRPGVTKRLRIDYDTLKALNPRIISCSVSGYGQTGPYKDRPSFDNIIQAMGGLMSYNGEEGRPPVKMGAPIGDMMGGIVASQGILAALYQRERTGQGQVIDIGLLDCQVSLLIYRAQYYWIAGEIAEPLGNVHRVIAPTASFQTKDGYVVIDAGQDKFFYQLCEAVGLPDLAHDPRFEHRPERLANRAALMSILQQRFTTKTTDEWLEILLAHDVPAGPVNTIDRVLNDPHVKERGMVKEVHDPRHPEYGGWMTTGNPIKLSGMSEEAFSHPPALGEHTDEILTKLLRYSSARVAELRERKVI
ncbi:MAG TPA: CoA transferase [Alphaproteobacteria bacterium]|nr:CoA transferase [Alphaproteobacteria bacterium]